jgi:hypothetical protein
MSIELKVIFGSILAYLFMGWVTIWLRWLCIFCGLVNAPGNYYEAVDKMLTFIGWPVCWVVYGGRFTFQAITTPIRRVGLNKILFPADETAEDARLKARATVRQKELARQERAARQRTADLPIPSGPARD